nr:hypothetical protein [Tanacetum cinerariifolium]
PRPDAIARLLTPSPDGLRRRHFMPATPSPHAVFIIRKEIWCSTWMTFGGNIRDLDSFGEETDKITDLHQISLRIMNTARRDGVAGIKRRRRNPSGDGVSNLAMASGRGRL